MHELVLRLPEALVESVSEALVDELEALSVSVADADAGTEAEQALFGEPGMPAPREGWQRSDITALFASEAEATEAAALVMAQEWAATVQVLALREVADQDWVRLTQSQFTPVEITPSFWVVPSWHEAPAAAEKVIRLDPGLAFGTGTHPTTRMCLRWTANHAPALAAGWQRVLDYGCGSGILAIGAALHGASGIDAVDIDEAAVQSTRDNAAANGVTLQAALPDGAEGGARGEYPLVLANILATPLKLLAPLLASHVAPGGHLVLAGILERQADELKAAYAPWLALEVSDSEDGWILMTAQRPLR
ncbi:50S ribosomal protein L11 methyltransferase [Aquabacterium sp. OR-4]|uniref:50S ribosomal protein L11 methyltransferase n=1 Tax=Aquabacterium sp. OR-4 TaxID=2978127 RepID=UPI0021B1B318|nr:50S ribosomal protein L11 methyltransferase [Aquabacterium sp. OR-4]MDT7834391.1 50S ribosomal protein L11 methyltransferase [Aquabacterium sp. OR-4]